MILGTLSAHVSSVCPRKCAHNFANHASQTQRQTDHGYTQHITILSGILLTIDGVCIGEQIYCPLTCRSYKELLRYC
jgi:hypothetical protein